MVRYKVIMAMAVNFGLAFTSLSMIGTTTADAAAIQIFNGAAKPSNAELLTNFDNVANVIDPISVDHGFFKGSTLQIESAEGSATIASDDFFGTPGDKTPYLSIGGRPGMLTVNLSEDAHYFAFNWGSLVSNATIQFFDDAGAVIDTITGRDAQDRLGLIADGKTSFFASFTSEAGIRSIRLSNFLNVDDVFASPGAISAVPLPAALPLFGAAVGGAGLYGRRRRKMVIAA